MSVGMYNMYKVNPFYDSTSKVELPNVMYKVKNFNGETHSPNMIDTVNMDPVSALEARQDAILAKLSNLRQTLDTLKGRYEVAETSSSSAPSTVTSAQGTGTRPSVQQRSAAVVNSPLGSVIHDIVINADPSCPPLSLFVLFELLKQKYSMLATSYVHSSVHNVDRRLCDMIKSGSQVSRGNHQLALSVVWKKVENGPELMVSPAKQSVVSGEVNIARYINRLLSPTFDTEDIVMATTADEWLDTVDIQILNGNSKQKNAAMKSLNVCLKKSDWLVGNSFSLVDAVMWSALNQSQLASSAPENVQKWLKACSAVPCFSNVLQFLS